MKATVGCNLSKGRALMAAATRLALADMLNTVTRRKKTPYKNIEKRPLNSIEFVGLFDTVEAFVPCTLRMSGN